jgi:hypothetical protein
MVSIVFQDKLFGLKKSVDEVQSKLLTTLLNRHLKSKRLENFRCYIAFFYKMDHQESISNIQVSQRNINIENTECI